MGSVGTVSRPDEFNGYFGARSNESFNQRLQTMLGDNIINPNYGKDSSYARNCALCAAAVPLYLRGYDVEAMARDKEWRGYDSVFDVDYHNTDNYILPSSKYSFYGTPSTRKLERQGVQNVPTFSRGADKVAQQVIDKVKSWGDGSVAVLRVKWKNISSSHAVNIVNNNGNVMLIDAQSGRKYNSNYISQYLKITVANHTTLIRLDNAPVKQNIKDLNKMFKKRSSRKDSIDKALDKIDWSKF